MTNTSFTGAAEVQSRFISALSSGNTQEINELVRAGLIDINQKITIADGKKYYPVTYLVCNPQLPNLKQMLCQLLSFPQLKLERNDGYMTDLHYALCSPERITAMHILLTHPDTSLNNIWDCINFVKNDGMRADFMSVLIDWLIQKPQETTQFFRGRQEEFVGKLTGDRETLWQILRDRLVTAKDYKTVEPIREIFELILTSQSKPLLEQHPLYGIFNQTIAQRAFIWAISPIYSIEETDILGKIERMLEPFRAEQGDAVKQLG
ncbi:MAG: hypothetical protein P1U32_05175 [Legionellaceae bacterium]|nr:hypothetical protein [Legionellaceae bacterium]